VTKRIIKYYKLISHLISSGEIIIVIAFISGLSNVYYEIETFPILTLVGIKEWHY
jgi:hypothetical protein